LKFGLWQFTHGHSLANKTTEARILLKEWNCYALLLITILTSKAASLSPLQPFTFTADNIPFMCCVFDDTQYATFSLLFSTLTHFQDANTSDLLLNVLMIIDWVPSAL